MSDSAEIDRPNDPFWEAFHERHPDVDIVLLPPAHETGTQADLVPEAPEPLAASNSAAADALWHELAGGSTPARLDRWIPGSSRSSVRHTTTLTLDSVNESAGRKYLTSAEALLHREEWSVFTPPVGMPRINAERPRPLGDEELLIGYAPREQRAFLRLTSPELPVSAERMSMLIGGTA